MASQQKFINYILDQIADAGLVSAKKMFGEYAIYCDGKVVAFFVTITFLLNLLLQEKHLWVLLKKDFHIQKQKPIF